MTLEEREQFMKEQIPMLDYQQISILEYDEGGVLIEAPFEPNQNVHQTAYAGALNSLLTAASWLCCNRMAEEQDAGITVVMQSGSIRFLRPHRGPIEVRAFAPTPEEWKQCLSLLKETGRATLKIHAEVKKKKLHTAFEGLFHLSKKRS